MEDLMETMCVTKDNEIHIYPAKLIDMDGDEDNRNSFIINYLFDKIDNLLSVENDTINFHVHTDKMKISQTSKYKKLTLLFIQIVAVKYPRVILNKCYLYDVNRAMKMLLKLIKPLLPSDIKTNLVIVKEVDDDDNDE
jgi:hypothetical protein